MRTKLPPTSKNHSGRLNFMGELSTQLEWQVDRGDRPVRVIYTSAGAPTAALLRDNYALVDHRLYGSPARTNTRRTIFSPSSTATALHDAVTPLMSKGLFGARDLHKHLWNLQRIPGFDPDDDLHIDISDGQRRRRARRNGLPLLREERDKLTVKIARDELRGWLRAITGGAGPWRPPSKGCWAALPPRRSGHRRS